MPFPAGFRIEGHIDHIVKYQASVGKIERLWK